jgi:hypothetical protein
MTLSKVSSLNSLFNSIYEQAIFVAREQNLMSGLVTNYTGSGMAARYLPIYPSLTAQAVSEGVDYSNATEWTKTAQMTLTPQIVKSQVVLTDARIQTDPDDARNAAADEMGGAIATKIDQDLLGLFSGLSTDKGTSGSALTIARCAAGMAVLTNNKARAPFFFVLHPYGWYDVWLELGQPSTNKALLGDTANEAIRQYYVGDWMNATWFASANISVDSTPNAVSGVFTREAFALDTRRSPSLAVEEDPSVAGYGYELNMEAWYAYGERMDDKGIALTHDATAPTGV